MSTIIKGYELRDKIGEGGFGTVHRAFQAQINREVAIKAILPKHANEPDFIRRFENEAQLVARLEHFHIVPLYDYWRDPDGAYLVMRWMKGGNLAEMIKLNGALDLPTASRIMQQLCTALAYAHQRGVVHRDLKPLNILLDEDGNAYVSDFGIAKDNTLSVGAVTDVDSILGSPEYIAPEQARGEKVTARTDIYGLGVILYEILAGEHPFPNLTPIEKMYKHLNSPLPLLTNLPVEVNDAVNMVIQQATAKNPAERYGDALTLWEAYQNAVDTFAPPASLVQILTRRERDILRLLIQGKSNKDIAQSLVVELATVKWYNNQLYKKLNVRSRNDLISKGRELLTQLDSLAVESGTAVEVLEDGTYLLMSDLENPYKGLRAFQVADAQDFFGREKIANKLITRLQEKSPLSRFLAVVGPSGSGKSSLVRAGLIPAVWRGAIPGSDKWFVADMLPGNRPLDELEIALIRVAGNSGVNIREQLERDQFGLLRATQLILPDDGSELLLVIDQFEEVFTLLEDEEQRQHFLALLVGAVTDKRSRVRVVVTLRADFYDRPLRYPEFGELIRDRVETILPLSAEELERAITKPAERVGVKFEDGLVASMVSAINYQPGALPLLQYALTELFDAREGRRITQSAYQQIGGVVGALAKSADSLYNEMMPEAQELTRQLFLRLVTLGEGTEDTRRRVARSELLAISPQSDAVEEILDIFVSARLLSLDNDPTTRTPTVEVAHEAILREWERLRNWLTESREDIKVQRLLATAAEAWKEGKSDISYLVSGARLKQFEAWAAETQLAQTPLEREFLQASLSEQSRQESEKRTQQAREEALAQRARKILQRLVAVFVLSTVIAVGLSIFAFGQQAKAQDAEAEAEVERDNAQLKAAEFRSVALASGAQEERFNKHPQNALALALEAVQMDTPPSLAQQVFFDIATTNWIRRQYGHESALWDAHFLFDSQRFVTTTTTGKVSLWDLDGNLLDSTTGMLAIETHPSQPLVAVTAGQPGLLLWNVDTDTEKYLSIVEETPTNPFAFNTDGSQLFAYTNATGELAIIDIATQTLSQTVPLYDGGTVVFSGDLSPDERYFLTSTITGIVSIWDTTTWEELQTLTFQSDSWVWDAQFIPNSPYVLAGDGTHGTVRLWDWQTNEIVWEGDTFGAVQDIAVSPDGRHFVTGNNDPLTHMSMWEVATGDFVRRFDGHTSRIQNIDFSPDGEKIITASTDGTAILWDAWDEAMLEIMPLPSINFDADNDSVIGFATDRERFAYANIKDETVEIRDIASGEVVQTFAVDYWDIDPNFSETIRLDFSPDRQLLVFTTANQIILLHLATGEVEYLVTILPEHSRSNAVIDVEFSPDGNLLGVLQLEDRLVTLRDVTTGEVVWGLESGGGGLVFSPTGQYLYGTLADGSVVEWNVATGEVNRTFQYPDAKQLGVLATNADGTVLFVALNDNSLAAWDIATGEVLQTFVGHTDTIMSITISPDGRYLLSGSTDKTLILWDYQTGEPLRRFMGHSSTATGDFNTDGLRIISMGDGGEIIIWDNSTPSVPLEEWVLDNRYLPPFTQEQCELYEIDSAKCPE